MYHSVAVTMRERRARSQREEDVGFKGHSVAGNCGEETTRGWTHAAQVWRVILGFARGRVRHSPPPLARVSRPLLSIYNT